ncbi:hypothetical protein [Synechococcus sp. J7-Johnson]|uniref:hypothetical protein n=1 Tax=Synechococcus sp. J7-Johnson TaxID=2823737 RepID=UPI0020CE5B73|nr:hypothetical protein [Synechococcus sp. J7-Johnson]
MTEFFAVLEATCFAASQQLVQIPEPALMTNPFGLKPQPSLEQAILHTCLKQEIWNVAPSSRIRGITAAQKIAIHV